MEDREWWVRHHGRQFTDMVCRGDGYQEDYFLGEVGEGAGSKGFERWLGENREDHIEIRQCRLLQEVKGIEEAPEEWGGRWVSKDGEAIPRRKEGTERC